MHERYFGERRLRARLRVSVVGTSSMLNRGSFGGGFWLLLDYKGDFGGMKFEGKGATGYDPNKKKYVSTWVDSMRLDEVV